MLIQKKNYCLVSVTCFLSLYCVKYMSCSFFCYPIALVYKHQWNTMWALARKHDIFTHVKTSPLLWLHNKSRLLQWNWNVLVCHGCLYNKQNITWSLGDTKFLFSCLLAVSFIYWKGQYFIVFGVQRSANILLLPTHTHTALQMKREAQGIFW